MGEKAYKDFVDDMLDDAIFKKIVSNSEPDSFDIIKQDMENEFALIVLKHNFKVHKSVIWYESNQYITDLLKKFSITNVIKLSMDDRAYFEKIFREKYEKNVNEVLAGNSQIMEINVIQRKTGQQAYYYFEIDILSDEKFAEIVSNAVPGSFDMIKHCMLEEFASIVNKHNINVRRNEILNESKAYLTTDLLKNFVIMNVNKLSVNDRTYFVKTFKEKFQKNVEEILTGNSPIGLNGSPVMEIFYNFS